MEHIKLWVNVSKALLESDYSLDSAQGFGVVFDSQKKSSGYSGWDMM